MKRILALLMVLVLCLGAFALTGCSKEKVLKIGMTVYKPMNYKDDAGNWTGFDTEFAEKAAKELGFDGVEFIVIDWNSKFQELNSGAIDCIWNGMTITDEVKANADATAPYVLNAQVVVMNKDKAAQYTSSESLKSLKVAVENGGAAADLLEDLGVTYTPVTAQTDALLEVKSGASDACVIDITMANNMLADGGDYTALTVAGDPLSEEEYGIAFKKGSDLTAKMNDIIAQYKKDGTFEALAKKYNLTIAE